MSFKDISIYSCGGHFVQWSGTVCAINVEGIMRAFMQNNFEFWPMIKEMLLKDISIFSSGGQLQFWKRAL